MYMYQNILYTLNLYDVVQAMSIISQYTEKLIYFTDIQSM